MADGSEADGGAGSGAASLAGYEYQVDVSVWLALDLVLVSHLTEQLELEPASQEDLEAELADTTPGRLVSRLPMKGYTLVVQAKRRCGDAWTPSTLRTLLKHGSEGRKSAAERLKNPTARYLLVTSAGLNGPAKKLGRRHAGSWPRAAAMPTMISKAFTHSFAGRVAVVANQDDERLLGDIDRLLLEGCRVPKARLADCRRKLREDARSRIARAGGGHWLRSDLEEVIREHDGYLASSPELEHYVHPTNWSDLRAAMAERSAAIIIGTSGTGKTLATKMLYEELRKEVAGLARRPVLLGPTELRSDATPRPVLFDIEDPWGRFDFDPASRPWNDQLTDVLAAARPDAMVIATSRHDVALASGALGSVKQWVVNLEAENYGPKERRALYRSRIDSLPRDLQALARGAERTVLDELATPLEIQKFFDAMRVQDRTGLRNPPGFVQDAINRAHQNSIESTVIEQIEQRKDVAAAAVLFGLLSTSGKVTRSVLREIEDALADRQVDLGRGVSPLVDFFVAARNLRQGEGGLVTYYHPRVEAGVTRTLEKPEHRQVVRRTLRQLLELLVSDDGPGAEWGAGASARILAAVWEKFGVSPGAVAAQRIDAWLDARLLEGGKDFEAHIELAARAGSAASNGGEIARFLRHRPDKTFGGFYSWGSPGHLEDWYAARAADPATRTILETFVRDTLPRDRSHFPDSFADELARLFDGLTPSFLEAASTAVHYGYISTDDVIAYGALKDLDGFEAIIDTAVEVLTPSESDLASAAATHLDIVNDVYSEDYAQYLAENDDGYTAGEFLKLYVARVRTEHGWRSVVQHRHAASLRPYWLRLLANRDTAEAADPDELAGAFECAHGTPDEDDVWSALVRTWDDRYLQPLEKRILAGSPHGGIEQAALIALIERAPTLLPTIIQRLEDSGDHDRLTSIACDLAAFRKGRAATGTEHIAATDTAAANLPKPFDSIGEAQLALLSKQKPRLGKRAIEVLFSIAEPSAGTRAFRLALDPQGGLAIESDVRWALAKADDPSMAVDGVEAAIRHGMAADVDAALGHRYAHVVARALTAIAGPLPAPLPARLLDLAAHRASPVRRALVQVLKDKPHEAHRPALITLAGDQWSKDSQEYGRDSDDYPIAQAAIDALAAVAPLPGPDAERLLTIATSTSDSDVRRAGFALLARTGGGAAHAKLFALSVEPGRARVRSSAAHSLLPVGAELEEALVQRITPQLLARLYEPVAGVLAVLLGWRGGRDEILAAAGALATNRKRRALLLLMAWTMNDRDRSAAEEVVAMLPTGRGADWALGADVGEVDDAAISDLGDPSICAEVLSYMRLRDGGSGAKKKRRGKAGSGSAQA
ncbi:hypothetical protein [Sphingomonas bacterium]|uniref:nSTAND3 domain-containing NTPase n=1 Tax=Sphingomonas bacterium TaxID=1895847 RepID=UPI0015755BCC|nr:hypothetical protein [Sphingomonas bacterium]